MLSTDDISTHFLNVRNKRRRYLIQNKSPESQIILLKTNQSNKLNSNEQYRNNLTDDVFENIVKKQLVYELDDYKTNYAYKIPNQVDKDFNFNLGIQDDILEFVNENMYGKNNVYKCMRLINETLEKAIKIFIKEHKLEEDDIKIIFYNDVVLRKIAEKFLYTLSNKSSINLSGYFDTYFNSDSLEWYVILHPELENYDKIHTKLKFYIALIMKQINMYIIVNRREVFEFFKYNNSYKQYIMLQLSSLIDNVLNNMKEYNRDRAFYEVDATHITPTVHSYKYEDKVVLLNNNADKHLFQLNIVESEENTKFRQCFNFTVLFKNGYFNKNEHYKEHNLSMSIPIQLATVTLSNKSDSFVNKLIMSGNNMRKYSYIFSLEDIFIFNGLSFKFICEQLEENAYEEEPWIIQNWKHIYGRLMFFYLIDLFVSIRSNRIRNSVVTLSKQYIDLLKEINKEFSKGDEQEMERVYKILLRKYDEKIDIKLITLIKNIHKYNLTYRYNIKFKEFIEFIYDILLVIENVFRGVYSYCTQSNDIFEKNLYKGNIKYVI